MKSWDIGDLHLITRDIANGTHQPQFDFNDDGVVTSQDLNIWVKDYYQTWIGDSNLDGEFNSSDLVAVFSAGEYEDAVDRNSIWTTGDWNGDGEFDSGDLVAAFQDGGFEIGARNAVASVPEPSSLVLIGGLAFLLLRNRRWRRNESLVNLNVSGLLWSQNGLSRQSANHAGWTTTQLAKLRRSKSPRADSPRPQARRKPA